MYRTRSAMFPHSHLVRQRERVWPGATTDDQMVSQLEYQLSFSAATASNRQRFETDTPARPLLVLDEMVDATRALELLDSDDGQGDADKEIDRVIADLLKAEDEAAHFKGELQKKDVEIHGLQRQVHELETLRRYSDPTGSASASAGELQAEMRQLMVELGRREQELADKTRELAAKERSWRETVQRLQGQHKAEEQKWQQELAKLQISVVGDAGCGRDDTGPTELVERAELQKLVDFYKKVSEGLSEKNGKLKEQVEQLSVAIAARDKELEEHIAMIQVLYGQSAEAEREVVPDEEAMASGCPQGDGGQR
ncbi:hypothetical protein OQA88_5219 [Cercophora sp. LCS_1]